MENYIFLVVFVGFGTCIVENAKKNQCALVRCDSTSFFLAKALHKVGFKTVVDLAFPDIQLITEKTEQSSPSSLGEHNPVVAIETSYPHECLRVLGLLLAA